MSSQVETVSSLKLSPNRLVEFSAEDFTAYMDLSNGFEDTICRAVPYTGTKRFYEVMSDMPAQPDLSVEPTGAKTLSPSSRFQL